MRHAAVPPTILCSALALALAVGCTPHEGLRAAQREAIDHLVRVDIADGAPGAAVGIVEDGRVVYRTFAGLADVDTEEPIGPETRFNIASNAKQFTALVVLRVIEEGTLALDDDVRSYLPELFESVAEPITVGQLIAHTSGIRDVYDLWSLQGLTWWEEKLDNEAALALLGRQVELNFDA